MTVFDFKDFFEKQIKIKTSDGKEFRGKLTGFEDEDDSFSGEDEIELTVGTHEVSIEVSSITAVSLIND